VLFDDSALYIAIDAQEPHPGLVRGFLTRRDESSPSDWVSVLIDSFHDRRTAFEFGISPAGVKYDRYWFNDTNNDRGWDAVWDAAATRDDAGWHTEFRIPFSQLRFKAGASGALGFAIARTTAHLNEVSTWPLLARSASGYVSSFGELQCVVTAAPKKRLELMPYVSSQVATTTVDSSNPLVKSPDPDVSLGLDLKYRVAPATRPDAR